MSPVCFWLLSELHLETNQDCKVGRMIQHFLHGDLTKKLNPGSHTICSKLPALCCSCGKTLCDAYFYCIHAALPLPQGGQRTHTEPL